jgi:hypothetical protein
VILTAVPASLIAQTLQKVGTIFTDRLTGQLSDHNTWLFLCFAIYLVLLFGFAVLYYIVYLRGTSSFIFASDIRKTAVMDFQTKTSARIQQIEAGTQIIRELGQSIKTNDDFLDAIKRASVFNLPCGWKCRVYRRIVPTPRTKSVAIVGGVTVYTKDDLHWFDIPLTGLIDMATMMEPDWTMRLAGAEERLKGEMNDLVQRLQSIASPHPDIWSFWDFLYFSTITQTTVGYGDILPNSTVVRMIVVCQILFGYLVIAIAINLVFFRSQ